MYHLVYSKITDIGDIRASNQDSILCLQNNFKNYSAGLFIVADGMGGLSNGGEASNYIVSQFQNWWNQDFPEMISKKIKSNDDVGELIEQEIWDINQAVIAYGNQVQSKVGSTLSLLLIIDDRYYIKNLGDSRIYLKRNKKLLQLTEDQSLVAQLIREKKLTLEEAKHYQKKNVLTMCIGIYQEPKAFSAYGKIKDRDQFLLCSDGLYNCMEAQEIWKTLSDRDIAEEQKAQSLRSIIQLGKAKDNVSAIVLECKKKGLFK
jgi:protein phosphatase